MSTSISLDISQAMELIKAFFLIFALSTVSSYHLHEIQRQLTTQECQKNKQKDGVTLTTECVLICQRKDMVAMFKSSQCFCFEHGNCLQNKSTHLVNDDEEVILPFHGL